MTILLVASAGGHIAQLHKLSTTLVQPGESVVWATFRSPQTESLLAGQEVVWLDYIPPRGARQIVGNIPKVRRLLKQYGVTRVYSTGSGIALSVFPVARARGIECTYIESAARSQGPSVTGRLLSRLPGVRCQTQYRAWADDRWTYRGSIFDLYSVEAVEPQPVRRVVLSVGTIRPYGFERFVQGLLDVLPDDVEALVQYGETAITDEMRAAHPRVDFREAVPSAELSQACHDADAVLCHSGIGSVLMAFDQGRKPLLMPRRQARGEHIDDHQLQIATELAERGLVHVVDDRPLTWDDVVAVAGVRVVEHA